MLKLFSLLVICVLVISGCALVTPQELNNKMNSLSERVSALEKKEASEYKTPQTDEKSVNYVSAVEIEAEKPQKSQSGKISMTAKEIQRALKNAGYYEGSIDGKLGKRSRKAIREFQADNGLKVDGIAGQQTKGFLANYLTK